MVSMRYRGCCFFFTEGYTVLRVNPDDRVARVCLKRCRYFHEHGVSPEWQAIESLSEK